MVAASSPDAPIASPPFGGPRVRLKAWLRPALATAATMTGIAFLWRSLIARHGVRILAFHGVETPPTNPLAVSVESFEAQAAFLAEHYDVIDLATFLKWRAGEYQSDKPKVVLTFDDGFRNNFQYAAPILEKYRLPGTFFTIGSKIADDDDRFIKAGDLRKLVATNLITVGSHSLSHVSMAQVDTDSQRREAVGSRDILERNLETPVEFFCFPYGTFNDFDDKSIAELKKAGYRLACTSINGVNFKDTDVFRLRRTKIEWSDDILTFSRILKGALDGWFLVDFFLRFLQTPRAVRFDRKPDGAAGGR